MSMEAIKDRISIIRSQMDNLQETQKNLPEDSLKRGKVREQIRGLNDRLSILLFAVGDVSKIDPFLLNKDGVPICHAMSIEDLDLFPLGPLTLGRGRDGELFRGVVDSPAGNGEILFSLQTRYNDFLAAGAPYNLSHLSIWDLKIPDGSPLMKYVEVDETDSFRCVVVKLATPPDSLNLTMSTLLKAHRRIQNALSCAGYIYDGWIRWCPQSVEIIGRFPYWEDNPDLDEFDSLVGEKSRGWESFKRNCRRVDV